MLVAPNLDKEMKVETDVLDYVIEEVLLIKYGDDK